MTPMFVILIITHADGHKDKILFDSRKQAESYFKYIMKRNPNCNSVELRKLKDNELGAIWR